MVGSEGSFATKKAVPLEELARGPSIELVQLKESVSLSMSQESVALKTTLWELPNTEFSSGLDQMINGAWFGRSIEHTIPRSLSSWTCSIVAWNPSYEQFARTLAVWLHPSELVQDLPTYGPSIEVPEYGSVWIESS